MIVELALIDIKEKNVIRCDYAKFLIIYVGSVGTTFSVAPFLFLLYKYSSPDIYIF